MNLKLLGSFFTEVLVWGRHASKRLILNQKPQKQNSTALLEDPVKAVRSSCTSKMISADGMELEEIDENKMIQMIQHQVLEAASQKEASRWKKMFTGYY